MSVLPVSVVLLALVACHVSLAQQGTTTTTTTTSGGSSGGSNGGGNNVIIGGAFGLVENNKRRRARSQDNTPVNLALSGTSGGRRRRNRGFKKLLKSRGVIPDVSNGNTGGAALGSDNSGLDASELSRRIEILANANKKTLDEVTGQQQQQRRLGLNRRTQDTETSEESARQGRARDRARKYFGNMGRGYMRLPSRAMETVNSAVSETLGGLTSALRMIPYDDIGDVAMQLAGYFQNQLNSGIPAVLLDSLLTSRVGGTTDTLQALLDYQDEPEILEPILEDVANNYKKLYEDTAGEVGNFLNLILPGRARNNEPDLNSGFEISDGSDIPEVTVPDITIPEVDDVLDSTQSPIVEDTTSWNFPDVNGIAVGDEEHMARVFE